MNKILLIAAVAFVSMTSCKKEYTCECKTTSTAYINGVTTVGTPVVSSGNTEKMKKDEAKTKCESSNGTTSSGNTTNGGKIEVACEIK